jgi:peroxiredoxin
MKWRSLEDTTARVEIRSLQEIYAERKELIARYVPEDVQAVHSCVVAELKESSIAEKSLQSGCKAPEFELSDHDGKLVRSSELLKSGPLIICFFRGRWCPFCVGQMEAMNVVYPEIRQLGASLVGISPQTTHQSYLMADQHKIQFSLLSDAGNRIARQFGLVYRVADYQQEIYKRGFTNLAFINGDASWELPIPATYIVGKESSVLHAAADADYTHRPEPRDLVEFLSRLPG